MRSNQGADSKGPVLVGRAWLALACAAAVVFPRGALAQAGGPSRRVQSGRVVALNAETDVEPHGVVVARSLHRGRAALRVIEAGHPEGYSVAIVKGTELLDGTIEMELAGAPVPNAPEGSRGFVGIAFRVQPGAGQFESFYVRPTNGRADDQLRRNHSTQYISHPGYPWQKLRAESPGVYESYVDLAPGEWTDVRIEIDGRSAQLFVNGASQPCLIVSDLKQEPQAGAIALWIGQGTEAFFRNLRIRPRTSPSR